MQETDTNEQLLWSVDDLKKALDVLRASLEESSQENAHSDPEKQKEGYETVFRDFIEEQLQNQERYKHILFTERGSVYFILKDEQCLRIKVDSGPREYQYFGKYLLQPITEKIVFLDTDYAQELLKNPEDHQVDNPINELSGRSITTTTLSGGVTPLEISTPSHPVEFSLSEDGTLTMFADEWGKLQGVHFGSPIDRIIK